MLSKSGNMSEENLKMYLYFSVNDKDTDCYNIFRKMDSRDGRGNHLSSLQIA